MTLSKLPLNEAQRLEVFEVAKQKFRASENVNDIIEFLKEQGISQPLSSHMLSRMGVGSPADCKELVMQSSAWNSYH
ncbi:MAG: hypothetical protein AAF250_04115 [Pseudomonadota bacterium]